jgi:hypothetical protein
MKNTILAFRRRIQQIEVEAAEKVNQFFKLPILDKDVLEKINNRICRAINGELQESFDEGVKFGKFIHESTKKAIARKKRD